MSTRERWTIYPLLFLALGVSLRDKLTGAVDLRSMSCEELVIRSHDQTRRAVFEAMPDGASRLVFYSGQGDPAIVMGLDRNGQAPSLAVLAANLTPQVMLRQAESGGVVETFNAQGQPQVLLANGKTAGIVQTKDGENQWELTLSPYGVYGVDRKAQRTFLVPYLGQPAPEPQRLTPHNEAPPNEATSNQPAEAPKANSDAPVPLTPPAPEPAPSNQPKPEPAPAPTPSSPDKSGER